MIRLAVLASGGGTNLQALLDACTAGRIAGRVEVLLSNVPDAGALARARAAGVATEVVPSRGRADREGYDQELLARLSPYRPDLVCLAGFMRLLTPATVRAFGPTPATRGCPRIVNIHPALLPAFPGLRAQRLALEHGAHLSGCTVHFVDEGADTGPIIVQAVVPVLPDDSEDSLSQRILAQEHVVYPRAVQWFAEGRLSLEGRRVVLDGPGGIPPAALRWPWDEGSA